MIEEYYKDRARIGSHLNTPSFRFYSCLIQKLDRATVDKAQKHGTERAIEIGKAIACIDLIAEFQTLFPESKHWRDQ